MFDLITAVGLGFLLDWMVGDPHWMPHPVRGMGWLIGVLERVTRCLFRKTPGGVKAAGIVTSVVTIGVSLGVGVGVIWLARLLGGRRLVFLVQILMSWQCIAARSLCKESRMVYDRLAEDDLVGARQAVSMIVGRDTEQLTVEEVTRAAVETVAENASDGVVAPLFFLLLGGGPLGLAYKAVNTLDSMIGYRNEKYLHFGWFGARLDDLANWIPARLAAMLMVCAAGLLGMHAQGAYEIWRRDCRNHASPNSAQTESACAGALGIQLAGNAVYGGVLHQKPTIGTKLREIQPADILRAGRLMYLASVLALCLFGVGRMIMILLIGG